MLLTGTNSGIVSRFITSRLGSLEGDIYLLLCITIELFAVSFVRGAGETPVMSVVPPRAPSL